MLSNSLPKAVLPLLGALLLAAVSAQAQDVYFSQPFATRLHTNPAFAGLLDDYSVTLAFRNQLPTLAGTFQTTQLAGDVRLPTRDLHHALGLVLTQDRMGAVGYTRLEVNALYSYHTRLTQQLALSAGLGLGYGRQRVGYDNLVFGDQLSDDGSVTGPTAEPLSFNPVNYFSVDPGLVLYTEQAWLSLAAHHLNQPSLGFRVQSQLPARLSVSGGYKLFLQRPSPGKGDAEIREISLTPTAAYTRQGASSRTEIAVYTVLAPLTLGAGYRNIGAGSSVERQQVLTLTVGISVGKFRLGYGYDAGLTALSSDLGGAHELTLSLRSFDQLDRAFRRLRRRAYPAAPFSAY
jgi:type IX secretion system PorP/SprF family membrane protein